MGLLLFLCVSGAAAPCVPVNLRCEYLVDPIGIGVRAPRFSWELEDARRGASQTAYQVVVGSSASSAIPGDADVWDSGQVASRVTCHVVCQGRPLRSLRRYYWRVRAWDADGAAGPWSRAATFVTGKLSPAVWEARWIGDATAPPPDSPAHNGYQSAPAARADAAQWVLCDLGRVRSVSAVQLYGARPYERLDLDAPGHLFPVRFRIELARKDAPETSRVVADRTEADVPNPGVQPYTCRFEPTLARYVRIVVTRLPRSAEHAFAFALAELEVLDIEGTAMEGIEVSVSGSLEAESWSCRYLCDGNRMWHPKGPTASLPAPHFRKEFVLEKDVRSALLCVSALGLYEVYLNGTRVGDLVLAPEWTDYDRRVQYQVYDVTAHVRYGTNAIGALLGDGWYAGRVGMTQVYRGRLRGLYGRIPKLLVELHLELSDGSRATVVSDATWRSSCDGPLRRSDIYDGVLWDARRRWIGWNECGFDDSGWRPVTECDEKPARLCAQMREPIRVTDRRRPRKITARGGGVYLVDFGQDCAGRVALKVKGPRAARVAVRHGSKLRADGSLYLSSNRGARQTDTYILAGTGTEEVLEPRFTYHGFRYAEVHGLSGPPSPDSITACVIHSDVTPTAEFACGNSVLNRIWSNVTWTIRSNLMGIPTDCCERDERLGWVLPALGAAEMYCYDLAAFVSEYAREVRIAQAADGGFANMAPDALRMGSGVPGWGEAAGVWMPWRHYVMYDDRRLLEKHYPAVRRWVEFLRETNQEQLSVRPTFGDWLNGDTLLLPGWPSSGAAVPVDVLGTAFCAHTVDVASAMAGVLGRASDEARYILLADEFRKAFARRFVDAQGRIKGDTQGGYAAVLAWDLIPEHQRERACRHLLDGLARYGQHLSTGNHTSHLLLDALSRRGRHPQAYALVTTRTCPSWGYMVAQGATSVWERWDSFVKGRRVECSQPRWQAKTPYDTYIPEPEFQDFAMNSFNHRGYVTVGAWMVEHLLGIQPDPVCPGFAHFVINPRPAPGLSWARGAYHSIRGRIEVAWQEHHDGFGMRVRIPPTTTATVILPAAAGASVVEGRGDAARAEGVVSCRRARGQAVLEIKAGRYAFQVLK